MKSTLPVLCAFATASAALCQTTHQIPLAYNFNGIVHAGEAGAPDDPNGFRAISDRALDFTAGVPSDALLNAYSLVSAPGALDIVHLGDRNLVDGGNWAFDLMPDGDNVGTQPTWLPSSDQAGPQTTVLAAPIALEATSNASFLFQVSNGGGQFDVTFGFATAAPLTTSLSAGDWFGGAYLGTAQVDAGSPDNNLSIAEGTVDLSAFAGDMLTSITFSNRSNTSAGYAVLAANVFTDPRVTVSCSLPLEYNFNGIVHAGEAGMPDAPDGYRSISDRGLDFSAGVPANPLLDRYSIVTAAGALDVVHLGNRNTVSGGAWAFDASADGDQIGIQPSWLPSVDQSGPQVTHFATPIGISSQSEASFLYQISNGGGTFDVTFDFLSGASTSATLAGGDWFGGTLPGTNQVDNGNPENNLSVTEGAVDLSAFAGELLVAISFSNRSNANAGYAILAANLTGTALGAEVCSSSPNSTGAGAALTMLGSDVAANNALCFQVSGLPANSSGYFVNSMETILVANPGGAQGDLCIGSNSMGRHSSNVLHSGSSGAVSFSPDLTAIPRATGPVAAMAGETWYWQYWYRDVNPGMTSNFSSARGITLQ